MRGSLGDRRTCELYGRNEPIEFLRAYQLTSDAFEERLRSALARLPVASRRVLVFIHGYKNTFVEAATRTAQIWADLEVAGEPAFFSWPSQGALKNYVADEASIEASEPFLLRFLTDIARESGASNVSVIAHSMGNRVLLRVVSQAVAKAGKESFAKFDQIILAAPDVDMDVFNSLAKAYGEVSNQTTLYVSRKDKAVQFSAGSALHNFPRVGAPPPFASLEKINTVEVRAPQGLLELGHSYFAEFGPVLDDIRSLILTNKPAEGRRRVGDRWVIEAP